MNNTKWEELRVAMYALGDLSPQFRIKDCDEDEPWPWDSEWYHHFAGYENMEWVELRTPSRETREAVRNCLRQIHVPGEETDQGFRLVGWIHPGESVNYIA
jgi:hypothetical protein